MAATSHSEPNIIARINDPWLMPAGPIRRRPRGLRHQTSEVRRTSHDRALRRFKGSNSVYIMPICKRHNDDDNVHMKALQYQDGVWLNDYLEP
jgi:hypothetical protein